MNNIQKRFLLFLIGCIFVRTLLVVIAKNNIDYLAPMGYIALLPAIGFTIIFLTDIRKTGGEVFGEEIWWNNLRPVHAILYYLFAINAIRGNTNSWIYLLIDVLIGLISFLYHHYKHDNFNKLF